MPGANTTNQTINDIPRARNAGMAGLRHAHSPIKDFYQGGIA
jgi:hypothetical protein